MALCVKVAKKKAEQLRQKLIRQGVFDPSFVPLKEGDFVFFPMKKLPNGTKGVQKELFSRQVKFHSVEDALRGKLKPSELEELVRSFDVIGDIALIELPPQLKAKQKLIGKAVMEVHRQVKVVAKKTGPMSGEFRVRKLEVIAGEKRTETLYKESGCRMKVDLAKAYFSPRLSFERKRIAEQVKKGEKILALFAGVGPFALVIARRQPNVEIAAIELNPDAVRLMKENIGLNGFKKVIKPILGDVHKVVPAKYRGWADRILMPLPKDAHEFLADAFLGAKKGCIVHFYHFAPVGKSFAEARKLVREAAKKSGRKAEFVSERVVRPFSPQTEQVVVDFKVR